MLDGKVCLVTGGTSGIGREIATGLARLGGTVTIVGRSEERCRASAGEITARTGNPQVSWLVSDLSSQQSIRAMAGRFKDANSRLDVLVNNAGVFRARREETADGLEYTFAVNHMAPFLLTNLLSGLLAAAGRGRVVTTSSVAHRGAHIDFDDLQFARRRYSGITAYSQSKLANILFTKELARRLAPVGCTANCFHPGGVRTGLAHENPWYYRIIWDAAAVFFISPEKGAETGVYLASSPEIEGVTGKYFVKRKEALPSRAARDEQAAQRLWKVSEELAGLSAQ